MSSSHDERSSERSATPPGQWRPAEPGEHRSPCPALNTLANCGYLPRDGMATEAQLVRALETHLGVAPSIGTLLAKMAVGRLGKPGPGGEKVLDLADLGLHGFIEHDASLTRRDAKHGDATEFVKPLLDQLVALSKDDKTLTLEDLTVAHQLRMAQSAADGHAVPVKAGVLGTAEVALLFLVLARGGAVAIADVVDLLEHEKLPEGFSPVPVTQPLLLKTIAEVAALGNAPFAETAKRARRLSRQIPEPEAARCPVQHGAKRAEE